MEIFKDIEGYEGLYQVSNLGKVKSLLREYSLPNGGKRLCKEKIMVGGYAHDYLIILLFKNGKRKYKSIHRLVAEHFIPNPENKKTVNHKNGIKNDNRIENLEWNTQSENVNHSFDVLGKKPNSNGFEKLTIQVSTDGFLLNVYESRQEASRATGIIVQAITSCIKGRSKTSGGFKWY